MNTILENLTGMNVLNDQTIAGDLLIASKTGVRNLAYAITETASPQIRELLKRHLDEAIDSHTSLVGLVTLFGVSYKRIIIFRIIFDSYLHFKTLT